MKCTYPERAFRILQKTSHKGTIVIQLELLDSYLSGKAIIEIFVHLVQIERCILGMSSNAF